MPNCLNLHLCQLRLHWYQMAWSHLHGSHSCGCNFQEFLRQWNASCRLVPWNRHVWNRQSGHEHQRFIIANKRGNSRHANGWNYWRGEEGSTWSQSTSQQKKVVDASIRVLLWNLHQVHKSSLPLVHFLRSLGKRPCDSLWYCLGSIPSSCFTLRRRCCCSDYRSNVRLRWTRELQP